MACGRQRSHASFWGHSRMPVADTSAGGLSWRRLQFFFDRKIHVRLESLIVLAILCVILSILSPYFLSISNFLNILLATTTIGVLAIGATLILSSGGLDLSIGSVLGFSVVGRRLSVAWCSNCRGTRRSSGRLAAGAAAGYVNGLTGHARPGAGLHRDAGHARHRARAGP